MKIRCPNPKCLPSLVSGPKKRSVVRNGYFFRKSDSRKVPQFFCKACKNFFTASTQAPTAYQKKRRITHPLRLLVTSGVSQRRAALILRVDRKTVVRRFRYIAARERTRHLEYIRSTYQTKPLELVQFDDLETAEHTKCKPLSVALAVDPATRKILSFTVSRMPAKGWLARTAIKKYGPRKDERAQGWNELMRDLKPIVAKGVILHSDENPHYVPIVKRHFPEAIHLTVKGGRGSLTGQGELKRLKYDPLFSLNHTCAMLRANLSRLFRKTWCLSKTRAGLIDHLSIYVSFHNTVLTSSSVV